MPLFCGQIITVCSLITQMHRSLNMFIHTTNSGHDLNMFIHTTNSCHDISHAMHCRLHNARRFFSSKCWFRTLVRRKHFCPKTWLCETSINYMDSLNLNCLKQALTTNGTCVRQINSLYCNSTFAINVYNIWPLPVHETLSSY